MYILFRCSRKSSSEMEAKHHLSYRQRSRRKSERVKRWIIIPANRSALSIDHHSKPITLAKLWFTQCSNCDHNQNRLRHHHHHDYLVDGIAVATRLVTSSSGTWNIFVSLSQNRIIMIFVLLSLSFLNQYIRYDI